MARGLTLYVCFGAWAGFHLIREWACCRLILGFVSFAVMTRDIECVGHYGAAAEAAVRAHHAVRALTRHRRDCPHCSSLAMHELPDGPCEVASKLFAAGSHWTAVANAGFDGLEAACDGQ